MREHEMKKKKCPYNNMENCIGKECVAWESLRDKDWVNPVFVTRVLVNVNGTSKYLIPDWDSEKEKNITDKHECVHRYGEELVNVGKNKIELVINETWAIVSDFEDGMEIGDCSLLKAKR